MSTTFNHLPPEAAAKGEHIEAEYLAAVALDGGRYDAEKAAREALGDAQAAKSGYVQRLADTSGAAPDERHLAELDAGIAKARAAVEIVARAAGGAGLHPELVGGIRDVARKAARSLNGTAKLVNVKVRAGGNIGALVDHRGELRARRQAIVEAPLPFDVAGELLVREVDRLAARGAPDGVLEVQSDPREPRPTNRPKAVIRWPSETLQVKPAVEGDFYPQVPEVAALVAWLNPQAVKSAVLAGLRASYATVELSLTADQRAKALREVDQQIAGTEREIAELVWAAVHQGDSRALAHLAGLSGEAILGVRSA